MFDFDGLAPKIRALRNTFVNWTVTSADLLLTRVDKKISEVASAQHHSVKLTSGTSWTHPAGLIDNHVLVTLVAAGASGCRNAAGAGGGGGGEVLYQVPYFVTGGSTAYSIGAGGAARSTDGQGNTGGNTTFGTLTARGGKGTRLGAGTAADGGDGGGFGGSVMAEGDANPVGGSEGGEGSGSLPVVGGDGVARAWRHPGGGGGGGHTSGGSGKRGGAGISEGGPGASDNGGGGGSWGPGGAGDGGAGVDGGGGGGHGGANSGPGGNGFIILEYWTA